MAVMVQFVVIRDGQEKMTFTSKKEADAYDKKLDTAERLAEFMKAAVPAITEDLLDELAMHFAENAGEAAALLKGTKPKQARKTAGSVSANPTVSAADEQESALKAVAN